MTRQPLIDREGRLAGFEFSLADPLIRQVADGASEAVLRAQASALIAALEPAVQSGRIAVTALPSALLADPALVSRWPPGAWLLLEAQAFAGAAAASLEPLRTAGVTLGSAQIPRPGAAFTRIDATGMTRAETRAAIAASRAAAPQVRLLTAGLGDVEDVEAALAAGADLAAGHHGQLRAMPSAAALPPSMAVLTRTLNLVLRNADLDEVAAELRANVGLSYELLRHANSPLLGLKRQIDAADQAVLLLGRDAMYRWLCARLLSAAPPRPAARALQEIALARAMLFERLALACGAPPSTLYTLGLLSLLDVMVQRPMAEVLAPLFLPADMRAALVDRTGTWGRIIQLASCLERGDLAGAAALADDYGGLPTVIAVNEESWKEASQAAATLWSGN